MAKDIATTGSYADLGLNLTEPTLADDLKDWREEHKLSQSKAAKRLGLSLSTYKRFEQGDIPNPKMLRAAVWAWTNGYVDPS
jgi:DNA-binding XRE family transcriptional regulator